VVRLFPFTLLFSLNEGSCIIVPINIAPGQ
jgi:hypothetical protein